MKKIDFIFVGVTKDPAFRDLEKTYHDKIMRYAGSRMICVRDSSEKTLAIKKRHESKAIFKEIKTGDVVVLCDESGTSFPSARFSQKLMEWRLCGKRLVFLIGGAYGVDDSLKTKMRLKLKLSDFTLPHELARVVLLEQVYRGLSILAGEKYHH